MTEEDSLRAPADAGDSDEELDQDLVGMENGEEEDEDEDEEEDDEEEDLETMCSLAITLGTVAAQVYCIVRATEGAQ
ncbi:hypothetical protein DFJ73DRAFT_775828 [Zopfochytrium polystomum]|nr:hypothetical protein DFJ73DRAFT_775828 [Zopfochytrium polystomum]